MFDLAVRILLIEDCPDDAEIVQRLVRTCIDPAPVVVLTRSLTEAHNVMQHDTFDVIVTDLGLPEQTGVGTIISIKEQRSQAPVIALTGMDDEDLGIEIIRAGAVDYLPKDEINKASLGRAILYAVERSRMQDSLGHANKLLEQKNERLAKMCQMSSQFVDNVSHEFRTPLTVIREFASIVRDEIDGPINQEQHKRLSTMINRTDDLAQMVDDLLDSSRLETGILRVSRKSHRLAGIVERVVDTLRMRASAKQIELKITRVTDDLTVFCDAEKLQRVLINLIVNAIKFTPQNGLIRVSAESSGDHMVNITVSDTGMGIPKDDLQRIFDRFQQVDAHHRMASCKGFGLGLSIARSLASLNLGQLSVSSVHGEGSQFSVTVPTDSLQSILHCYFEQRSRMTEEIQNTIVFEVSTDPVEGEHREEIIEAVDDFVRESVYSFDLVLHPEQFKWVIYSAIHPSSAEDMQNRLQEGWAKVKRNYYGIDLPHIRIEPAERTAETIALSSAKTTIHASPKPTALAAPLVAATRKKVIVIDDEVDVAEALSARLMQSGYDVTTAHDGLSGLNAVNAELPDAILMDIRMPKMDGFTVLKTLKANAATASTPVVILSASLQDKQRVLDKGASFFIQKPFQSSSILKALDHAIKTSQRNDAEPVPAACL